MTTAKDAIEILGIAIGVLEIEKESLIGKANELEKILREEVVYLQTWVEKLGKIDGKIFNAEKRIKTAETNIKQALESMSHFMKLMNETYDSDTERLEWLQSSYDYWEGVRDYWTDTLPMEKYTLAMYKIDRLPIYKKVHTLGYVVVPAMYDKWQEAENLGRDKVAELLAKTLELELKQAEQQVAIADLQTALSELSGRMDENEQLDAEQQQQIDVMWEFLKSQFPDEFAPDEIDPDELP